MENPSGDRSAPKVLCDPISISYMSPPGLAELAARLLRLLNERVRRGEMSERSLARMLGYSQPHIHNVLHGRRGLTIDVADHILETLAIPLDALLGGSDAVERARGHLPAPWLDGPLGAGAPFPREPTQPRILLFPAPLIEPLTRPFAATISPEEESMHPTLQAGDVALFDRDPRALGAPDFEGVYAVRWQGRGYVCRCRRVGGRLVTVTDFESSSAPPTMLDLEDADVTDVVRGEAVWVGRTLPRPR